jgi:hypothetical protein
MATAQPGPPPQPPPPPVDTTTTTTTDPGPPEPTLQKPDDKSQPQPQPTVMVAGTESSEHRPATLAFALGLGYQLPTSLQTPNRTSARVRLISGLTFEPFVTLSNTSEDMETPMMMETQNKLTELGIGVLGRFPIIAHDRVDFEILGTLGFANERDNPEGDYNTRTTNTFGIGWGIGIGYWISHHWQLSMSVTNDLVTYAQTKQQTGPSMTTKSSTTTIGVIFQPAVFAMIHLYN